MIINGQYYLITADTYFFAPDGEQYIAAWGKCEIVEAKECFGFIPLRPSTNWFCKVGNRENEIIIAGCQIHFAVRCTKRPKIIKGKYTNTTSSQLFINNKIYFTE